jgi:hypothetical protein
MSLGGLKRSQTAEWKGYMIDTAFRQSDNEGTISFKVGNF